MVGKDDAYFKSTLFFVKNIQSLLARRWIAFAVFKTAYSGEQSRILHHKGLTQHVADFLAGHVLVVFNEIAGLEIEVLTRLECVVLSHRE